MKKLLYLFALCGLLVSCDGIGKDEDTLDLGIADVVISSDGGSETVSFIAPGDWSVSADKSWISFEPSSGNAGQTQLTVNVDSANGNSSSRSAKVTIAVGSETGSFRVVQEGSGDSGEPGENKDRFDMQSRTEYKLSADAQSFNVRAFCTDPMEIIITDECDWMFTRSTRAAMNEESETRELAVKTVYVKAHDGSAPRITTIMARSGGKSCAISVVQFPRNYDEQPDPIEGPAWDDNDGGDGGDETGGYDKRGNEYFSLWAPYQLTFTGEASEASFKLELHQKAGMAASYFDDDWIGYSFGGEYPNYTFIVKVDENPGETRTGQLILNVNPKEGEIYTETIVITQVGKSR